MTSICEKKKLTNVFIEFHYFAKAVNRGVLQKRCSKHVFKTRALESPMNIAKLLRIPILKSICKRHFVKWNKHS